MSDMDTTVEMTTTDVSDDMTLTERIRAADSLLSFLFPDPTDRYCATFVLGRNVLLDMPDVDAKSLLTNMAAATEAFDGRLLASFDVKTAATVESPAGTWMVPMPDQSA